MNAVVLAGGGPDAVSALTPGAANKAFVPIAGTTLVERTVRALREVPRIERIVVVAPRATHDAAALAPADERRDDGRRMIESLESGLRGFAADEGVLVAASDLPALTRAAIDEVLDAAAARDVDIAYACLERRSHDARYPQIPHTWARMREGRFCGGGVCVIKPRALRRLAGVLDALGAARKAPLRLAAVFGWDVLLRFAVGQLSIAQAEARASRILGAPVGAIVCTHPEIAVNVDRPGDVALAEELLRYAPDQRANNALGMPN
ncbi:MAG: nucleotidyltransferase family protein [Candidatus Velthaea sp.]